MLSPPCPLTPRHCVRSSFLDFPIALHAGPTAIFITVYSFHLTIKLSHMKMPINILAFLTYNMATLHGSTKMLACQPSLAVNPKARGASGPVMCAEWMCCRLAKCLLSSHLVSIRSSQAAEKKAPGTLPFWPPPLYPFKTTWTWYCKSSFLHNFKTSHLQIFQSNMNTPLDFWKRRL